MKKKSDPRGVPNRIEFVPSRTDVGLRRSSHVPITDEPSPRTVPATMFGIVKRAMIPAVAYARRGVNAATAIDNPPRSAADRIAWARTGPTDGRAAPPGRRRGGGGGGPARREKSRGPGRARAGGGEDTPAQAR